MTGHLYVYTSRCGDMQGGKDVQQDGGKKNVCHRTGILGVRPGAEG